MYLGEEDVIHFSGNNKDAKPRTCKILEFFEGAQDRKIYKVEYDQNVNRRPQKETLSLAENVLRNPDGWPKYNVIANNCESFACWLTMGIEVSAQSIKGVVNVLKNVAQAVHSSGVASGHSSGNVQ